MRPPTVHLVDASPYIFRAFFSLPASMTDPEGRPVGAVYGFVAFLAKLLADEAPTHLAVAFDGSLTTSFRNEIYPAYKSGRELPPPELEAQQERCREAAAALGAATFVDDRYEADDLIATLLAGLRGEGAGAVIVTSDKDLAQLVDDRVELFDFARGERLGPAEVAGKLGAEPAQVPDLLALAGDPVDDIPGIRGIGPKTAAALLAHRRDLDAIYADLDAIAELPLRGAAGVRRKLEAGREEAFLSRRLATVSRDAPAAASLEELAWEGASRERVEELFARWGFGGLVERIPRWADGSDPERVHEMDRS